MADVPIVCLLILNLLRQVFFAPNVCFVLHLHRAIINE
nr:MAG TPA: hypothetical protein [Caudoviricetes sp.]